MLTIFEGTTYIQKMWLILEIAMLAGGLIWLLIWLLTKFLGGKKLSVNVAQGQVSYSQDGSGTDGVSIQSVASGVFLATLETVALMTQIKTKLILHDQMMFLEERLVMIRNSILESYRGSFKGREDVTLVDTLGTQEYLLFKSLVDLMKEDMKSNVRMLFLRNHFSSYNEQELLAYISEKNQWLLTEMYEFLREMYPANKLTIPFTDVESSLNKIRPELEEYLVRIFKKAVQINRERNQQIADMEKSLRDRIRSSYNVEIEDKGVSVFSMALKGGESSYERRS